MQLMMETTFHHCWALSTNSMFVIHQLTIYSKIVIDLSKPLFSRIRNNTTIFKHTELLLVAAR